MRYNIYIFLNYINIKKLTKLIIYYYILLYFKTFSGFTLSGFYYSIKNEFRLITDRYAFLCRYILHVIECFQKCIIKKKKWNNKIVENKHYSDR